MGLLGDLFTKTPVTKKEVETTIKNSQTIQNSLTKLNEQINKTTAESIQKSMIDAAAGQEVNQTIRVENVTTGGDFVATGISQKAQVKMNLTAMQDTKADSQIVQDAQAAVSNQLKDAVEAAQSAKQQQGEQIVSGLAGAVSDMFEDLVGNTTNESTKTAIENELNVSNTKNITDRIVNDVKTSITNETMTKINSNMQVNQTVEFRNIAAGGDAIIANISQEAITSQITEAVQKSGVGADVLTQVLGVDKTVIETAISSGQAAGDIVQGTGESIGAGFQKAFEGTGGIMVAIVSVVLSVVVGGVGFLMLSGGGSGQVGGSTKMLSGLLSPIMKLMKKNQDLINVALMFAIAMLVLRKIQKRENFSKTSDLKLKVNQMYVFKNPNNVLCLTKKQNEGSVFKIQILAQPGKDKRILLSTKEADKDMFLKLEGRKLVFRELERIDKELYEFSAIPVGENGFQLYMNNTFIGESKSDASCLELTQENEAAGFIFRIE
jgi:hypothetical protein